MTRLRAILHEVEQEATSEAAEVASRPQSIETTVGISLMPKVP